MREAEWTYWAGIHHLMDPEIPPGLYGDVAAWMERFEAGWHAAGWERVHAAMQARLMEWSEAPW